jgi:Cellobiose phosphorylase
MLSPINHAISFDKISTYKVEPYVMAADVYAVAPHNGRGGWTWYTGSAGWMYRFIVESLLGIKLQTNEMTIVPCIPAEWKDFKVHNRYRETVHHITVRQVDAGTGASLHFDGKRVEGNKLCLADDRREHFIEVHVVSEVLEIGQSLIP